MNSILAYCGILCNECPAYKATVSNDDALREKTAEEWRKMFSPDIQTKDINCLGCSSDVLFGYCKTCEIRACASEKKLIHCGTCDTFACQKVEGILKNSPECRERLKMK